MGDDGRPPGTDSGKCSTPQARVGCQPLARQLSGGLVSIWTEEAPFIFVAKFRE